jgi:hypothetical protein
VLGFGFDAVAASGSDVGSIRALLDGRAIGSCILVSCLRALTFAH